jgi:amidohydrolase
MDLKLKIKELSEGYFEEIRGIRRHIHQNPELSFKEFKTSEFVQSKLDSWGIAYENGFVKTGIVATINGNGSGKTLALRADLDALPIHEGNLSASYRSQNEGVMHACGHDVHTASLLGTIKILNELKDHWKGELKCIFQPGEELLPGGAKLMIEEGALSNPVPNHILGQHVYPDLEVGKVGFRSGTYMASTDELHLKVKGVGGHAALPHKLVDSVYIASQIIVSLQQVVSRKMTPYIPAVISFGYVSAMGATNVIPEEVVFKGTLRTFDEELRKQAHLEIERTAKHIAESMGATCEVEIRRGYPFLKNDVPFTEFAKGCAIELLGAENVVDLDLRMTAEDFAYYSQIMPACFYRIGTAEKGKENEKKLHHPEFDIAEDTLKTSVSLMAFTAYSYLK